MALGRPSELLLNMKLLNKIMIETVHFLFLCYGKEHCTTPLLKGWSIQEKPRLEAKPPPPPAIILLAKPSHSS